MLAQWGQTGRRVSRGQVVGPSLREVGGRGGEGDYYREAWWLVVVVVAATACAVCGRGGMGRKGEYEMPLSRGSGLCDQAARGESLSWELYHKAVGQRKKS